MSKLLNSGTLSKEELKEQRKTIQDKWEKLGFLDGLKGHIKPSIAELMCCEASTLLNEVVITGDSKDLTVYEKD